MIEIKEPLASAGKTFAEAALHPFTKQREVAACQMGLQFGFVARYKPQYFLRDTILTLWLCSIDVAKGEWSVDRAEAEPDAAAKAMYAWAEKMGIGIDTPRFEEGYKVFTEIMREVQAARGEPVLPAKTARSDESEL